MDTLGAGGGGFWRPRGQAALLWEPLFLISSSDNQKSVEALSLLNGTRGPPCQPTFRSSGPERHVPVLVCSEETGQGGPDVSPGVLPEKSSFPGYHMGENLQTQGAEQASIGSCRRRVPDHAGVFLTALSTGPVRGAEGLQTNKPYALCWSHGGQEGEPSREQRQTD